MCFEFEIAVLLLVFRAEMYAHCPSMMLRLPVTNCMDSTVSCDRSLTCEFPRSPSSQLMYESEPLQDQCCVRGQSERSVHETRVISPSVEGLTFNDNDILSYVFANEQLPAMVSTGNDEMLGSTATKYLSDAWKMTDRGPTLTQLNSEDLEATLLDDFGVSSSGFCVDMSSLDCSQLIVAKPVITNTTSMPSTATSCPCWSQYMGQQREETARQQQQQQEQLMSHIVSSQRQVDSVPQCAAHTQTTASSASTTHLSLDHSWEAIESFLKSEDERMAAKVSNHQQHQLQLAADIKTEAPGI